MFDYVVCFYFGHRRAPITNNLLLKDKYILVKRHLDFIKKYLKRCKKLNNIYFIINNVKQNDDGSQSTIERLEIEKLINSYGLNNVILVQRKNIDFSYGAWNEAILLGMDSESEYAFLSEDDYIPKDSNFYKYFIEKFDNDTAYVCQLYTENGVENNKVHAAMSSGFISYEKAKIIYEQYGSVLKLVNKHDDNIDESYNLGQVNQVYFLDYFKDYKITDVSEQTFSVFLDMYNTRTSHGNLNGVELIVPIIE
jgi:hypothetical protein